MEPEGKWNLKANGTQGDGPTLTPSLDLVLRPCESARVLTPYGGQAELESYRPLRWYRDPETQGNYAIRESKTISPVTERAAESPTLDTLAVPREDGTVR